MQIHRDERCRASRSTEPTAAVAIIRCLVPTDTVLLVRRVRNSRDPWSGHFAFPGGRRDRMDTSLFATCVREVAEETGIDLDERMLAATLQATPAGRRSQSPVLVQPYLFEVATQPAVQPAAREIETYYWLETASFRSRENHIVTEVVPGLIRSVFPLDDYYIWGFTYSILCELFGVRLPAGPTSSG